MDQYIDLVELAEFLQIKSDDVTVAVEAAMQKYFAETPTGWTKFSSEELDTLLLKAKEVYC